MFVRDVDAVVLRPGGASLSTEHHRSSLLAVRDSTSRTHCPKGLATMSEHRCVRFEIEWVAPDGSYLIARQLGPGDFSWPPGTRLAGREVRGVTIRRALDRSGRQRFDLFAFRMATTGLAAGQVVELEPP